MKNPKVMRYGLAGSLLATGSPLGWLLFRWLKVDGGVENSWSWAGQEIGHSRALYFYLWLATTVVFTSCGAWVGVLYQRLEDENYDLNRHNARIKNIFGKYFSKAVAERALSSMGEIELGGEQREVTILFSDIRGFTSISENIPPHEMVQMLNEYFTLMVDVIFKHDGTLDKYIGDEIMAVFGAPLDDNKSAVKAIKTSLEMIEVLGRFNQDRVSKGQPPFDIGIGISTGIVVAGNLGSVRQLSYTVIGEEVNLASRLCSNALKGQILISESTYRKVKWDFEFNRLEPIAVKNVTFPVQVYEVLSHRQNSSGQSDTLESSIELSA